MTVARVTIEDCLEQVPNRFSLIHLAFQRIKQLRSGAGPFGPIQEQKGGGGPSGNRRRESEFSFRK